MYESIRIIYIRINASYKSIYANQRRIYDDENGDIRRYFLQISLVTVDSNRTIDLQSLKRTYVYVCIRVTCQDDDDDEG